MRGRVAVISALLIASAGMGKAASSACPPSPGEAPSFLAPSEVPFFCQLMSRVQLAPPVERDKDEEGTTPDDNLIK